MERFETSPLSDDKWCLGFTYIYDVLGVFVCHFVVLSVTFHPNWNVLHPLSPVLMNACFSLGASPRG